jgi:hypothetical protein
MPEEMATDHVAQAAARVLEQQDWTIQVLYGIGLKLEYCLDLLTEAPDQARDGLDSVIVSISDLIDDVRGRIQADNDEAPTGGKGPGWGAPEGEGKKNVRSQA